MSLREEEMERFKQRFTKLGWFAKDRFALIRDNLTIGHGSGPDKYGVKLKMPDAAYFFYLANNKNKEAGI
jgi:hypothetical protein